jgi:hypothetical protein
MKEQSQLICKVSTRMADNILRDDGILEIKLKNGIEIEVDVIRENYLATQALVKGRRCPVLVDARVEELYMSSEARELSASQSPGTRVAEAVLVNTLAIRLMGNFYINFNKPTVPTKLFTSEEDAIAWLKTFI